MFFMVSELKRGVFCFCFLVTAVVCKLESICKHRLFSSLWIIHNFRCISPLCRIFLQTQQFALTGHKPFISLFANDGTGITRAKGNPWGNDTLIKTHYLSMLALFQVSLADSLKWAVLLGQRPLASAAKGSGIRPAKKGKNRYKRGVMTSSSFTTMVCIFKHHSLDSCRWMQQTDWQTHLYSNWRDQLSGGESIWGFWFKNRVESF